MLGHGSTVRAAGVTLVRVVRAGGRRVTIKATA